MKKLLLLAICSLALFSCSSENCRTCKGTVTSTGDAQDWTVCQEDEMLVVSNNISGDTRTSTNTLPEAVAFYLSIGLSCEE